MPANNLPSQPTPFIGREKEQSEIAALLANPACRLLTLVGSGGIGKTRLAIQAAAAQIPRFADGVIFVSLAPVGSPDLLSSALAGALEISFYGLDEPHRQIANALREKQLLLVMDNFEHLLQGTGLLIDLLQAAPGLKILATSRERLNLREEWVFILDGLSYPTEPITESLENYSAVQLFVQRAQQVNIHFDPNENTQAILSICQRVEGLPLGLELAASWLRAMSCTKIVEQMERNLDFLTSPLHNIPERHRSLRMVFEQSWNMLSPHEQTVLMKLSIFHGGFDLEASVDIADASLTLLAGLVDKSLIRLNNIGRYDLHELLRQYASEKLAQVNEVETIAQRHLDYFTKLADQAEKCLFGSQQFVWFDRLETEFDNLRTALGRSLKSEAGLRLAASLGWFFSERTHWNEGLAWLEQILASNPDAPISLRAKALHSAGAIAGILGEHLRSQILGEEALALARETNDEWNIAWALNHLALYPQSDPADQSAAMYEESLALFRALNDPMGVTHTLVRRAWAAFAQRDYPYVLQLLNEAGGYAEQYGDQVTMAWITYTTSWLYRKDRDLEQSKIYLERSLAHFRATRFQMGSNNTLMMLAAIEQEMGNITRAQTHNKDALIAFRDSQPNHHFLPIVLVRIANLLSVVGERKRAVQLLGASHSIILDTKHDLNEYPELEQDTKALRIQLDEATFAQAWAAGCAMTRAEAIAYALEDSTSSVENSSVIATDDQLLTHRELEILTLLADGLNSTEIAQHLVLSVGTVRWYLKSIYNKLDVHSRSEAIAHAKALHILA